MTVIGVDKNGVVRMIRKGETLDTAPSTLNGEEILFQELTDEQAGALEQLPVNNRITFDGKTFTAVPRKPSPP